MKKDNKPFSSKILIIILFFLLVLTSLAAGYFQAALKSEKQKSDKLEVELATMRDSL